MMKKRWLSLALVLAFCLILIPAAAMAAEAPEVTVTVGDGTDYDEYIPSYSGYNYGKSQYVIPASELTEINGMTITGLKWYLESTSSRPARRTQIVLSEMEGTTLSGLVDVSDQPVAFAGLPVWTVGSGGEILITFNTPYEYHGGNLLVTTLDVTGDYASGNYFYGVYNDIPAYISYSDSTKYSFASTGGYSDSFLPKTTLICGDPSLAPEVPVETYGLWIAGTQVTERNAGDLTQIEGVSGTAASYDPEKKTLTLDSVAISGGTYKDATVYSNIDDLEINISGSCSITTDSNYGVNADENLYIKGDGSLTVTGGDMTGTESSAGIRCWALSAGGNVTVYANGGTAERISYGVYASSEVYVSGEASLIAEGGAGASSYGMYAGGGLYAYGSALLRSTGGSAEFDSYGVYVSGGDLRMEDPQLGDPTIILSGGSGGRSSFGLYFYQKNNYGLSYGYVYLLNQKVTITGETAAVAHYFTDPPAPSLARSVPAAFVSDNADGSGLQLYKGSVKDDAGEYYKYLSTVPPEGFEAYSLWVGGTRISSMNAADILGDGKASYDPASNTLTLDGAVIQSPDGSYYENNKAVCYSGASPFTVEARGTNTLTGGGNSISYSSSYEAFQYESAGIYSSTDLTINLTDGAELSLNGGYSYTYPSYGIWGAGNLTVTGSGTANISSGTIRDGGSGDSFIGARFYGDLTMDGAADVNISS